MITRTGKSVLLAAVLGTSLGGMPMLSAAQLTSTTRLYQFLPDFWRAGLDDSARRDPALDLSSTAIAGRWRDLNFGLIGSLSAKKDRYGILADGIHVKFPETTLPRPGTLDSAVMQPRYSLAGTHAAVSLTSFDLVGGARYNYAKTSPGADAGSGEMNKLVWDPFVGVRVFVPLADHWTLTGYADFGALNGTSDRQIIGSVHYMFNERISGKFGYRLYRPDFDRSEIEYDIAPSGFFAGVGIRF